MHPLLIPLRARLFQWAEAGKLPRFLTAPCSALFYLGVKLRHFFYDVGLFRSHQVNCVVVSVGNIEAGGTGKTPLVLLLAEAFRHRKIALLTRGYGEVADEALLLAKRAPWAKVYVGKDRLASARKAVLEGAELIILDDGLQHRRLKRDVELIVLSEKRERRYLPWGRLRDLPARIQEATALFSQGEGVAPISLRVVPREAGIAGKKVAIFSAIGNPHRFRRTVEEMGATILLEKKFVDHATFSQEEIVSLAREAKEMGCEMLLCTEKDHVKISFQSEELPLCVVEIGVEVAQGKGLWEKLIEKIEQKIDTSLHV